MSWTPTKHQRTAIQWAVAVVFSGALILAALTFYYFERNRSGRGASSLTSFVAILIKDRGAALDTFRILVAALPALAVAVCVRQLGQLTRIGVVAVVLLLVTMLAATPAAIFLAPLEDSPEGRPVAIQVVQLAKDLTKFSLTYMFMLLGLGLITEGDRR